MTMNAVSSRPAKAPVGDTTPTVETLRRALRDPVRPSWLSIYKEGESWKADLLEAVVDGKRILIKDFGRKSAWVRLIGRFQVARECAAYQWLGPMKGLPAYFGRLDKHSFAIDQLDACPLSLASNTVSARRQHIEQLRSVIDALHQKGLYHLDLRNGKNVLVDASESLWVIDFASAIWFRPGSRRLRFFERLLDFTDYSAYLKHKARLLPGAMSPEEQKAWRRHHRLRSLWPFNRKKKHGNDGPSSGPASGASDFA